MNVFEPGEGLPLAPSICFICEQSPQDGAIDTFRTFQTHVPTKLTGRKYVCKDCVKELGSHFGLIDPDFAASLEKELGGLYEQLAEAHEKVEQLEALHIGVLRDLIEQAKRPAPTKAPTVKE